ncbi:hypothetical protein [Rubritalea profundi]|uniref:hypothetical protein n=1 Tax=Rubritalea profundi TaxID=1658618 RepID=UPI00101ADF19|nr:hypothetical protein [Rubritalea profundi]
MKNSFEIVSPSGHSRQNSEGLKGMACFAIGEFHASLGKKRRAFPRLSVKKRMLAEGQLHLSISFVSA